jgi:hypothetical protein
MSHSIVVGLDVDADSITAGILEVDSEEHK